MSPSARTNVLVVAVLTSFSCYAKYFRPPGKGDVFSRMVVTVGATRVDSTQKYGSGQFTAIGAHLEIIHASQLIVNPRYLYRLRQDPNSIPVWDLCIIQLNDAVKDLKPISLGKP